MNKKLWNCSNCSNDFTTRLEDYNWCQEEVQMHVATRKEPSADTPKMHWPTKRTTAYMQKKKFKAIVKNQPWRAHQSVATVCEKNGGYCQYRLCPGLNTPKKARKRPFTSVYRCYECSVKQGRNVYLCNTTKQGKAVLCHMNYHTQMAENAAANSSEIDATPPFWCIIGLDKDSGYNGVGFVYY